MPVACFVLAAILAPLITSHDPVVQNLPDRRAPPSWQKGGTPAHPLGTDQFGRDVWSRLVYGARTSLIIALGAPGRWRGGRDSPRLPLRPLSRALE